MGRRNPASLGRYRWRWSPRPRLAAIVCRALHSRKPNAGSHSAHKLCDQKGFDDSDFLQRRVTGGGFPVLSGQRAIVQRPFRPLHQFRGRCRSQCRWACRSHRQPPKELQPAVPGKPGQTPREPRYGMASSTATANVATPTTRAPPLTIVTRRRLRLRVGAASHLFHRSSGNTDRAREHPRRGPRLEFRRSRRRRRPRFRRARTQPTAIRPTSSVLRSSRSSRTASPTKPR